MMDANTYNFLSNLEKKVYNWLSKKKIYFTTQEPMFGMYGELGSATIDFIIPDRNLALRVMSSYWHSTLEAKARDLFGKEQLIGRGYVVVDLQESDLEDIKIENTMQKALRGEETLR